MSFFDWPDESAASKLLREVFNDLGGPREIPVFRDRPPQIMRRNDYLVSACELHPFESMQAWLFPTRPETERKQAWPWVALLGTMYQPVWHELDYRNQDLTPAEAERLMKRIAGHLDSALQDWGRIRVAAEIIRPIDGSEDNRARLYRSALEGVEKSFWGISGPPAAPAGFNMLDFESMLRRVLSYTAQGMPIKDRLPPESLRRNPERVNRLSDIVLISGALWFDMLGKRPSAERVHRKAGSQDPPFVIFLQNIAALSKQPPPTRSQVATTINSVSGRAAWAKSPTD